MYRALSISQLRRALQLFAQTLDDERAMEIPDVFPMWARNRSYSVAEMVIYGVNADGDPQIYRCVQSHTSQAGWEPDKTPALWKKVEKPGQGDTPDNPIPYSSNMALVLDKYYSQYDVVYRCIRDTINPVYANLADLVGLYVEVYNL